MKKNNIYYFSVEGETEKWYLKWLENLVNNDSNTKRKITIKCEVQKNPLQYVKKLNIISKTTIYHLSDYESHEDIHVKQFEETMQNMKKASSQKQIIYKFSYSNLTFDLWIILHKANFNCCISDRKNYISILNKAYSENFQNMNEYKHEKNFKRCLQKLNLDDVVNAIERAKRIMEINKQNNQLCKYCGFTYYKENPALDVWQPIEKILKDCGFIKNK